MLSNISRNTAQDETSNIRLVNYDSPICHAVTMALHSESL